MSYSVSTVPAANSLSSMSVVEFNTEIGLAQTRQTGHSLYNCCIV